ncbi:MAG: hypothetical protein V1720_02565 [bacterium]
MYTNKLLALLILSVLLFACGTDEKSDKTGTNEQEIREYNLDVEKEQAKSRTPCDTIALQEHVISSYPDGTYLVDFDRTYTYSLPKPAVLYYRGDANYVFGVIAKSKPTERNIESKNVVGFESSYINLDSTKLGTAFFFLTLFECNEGSFNMVWEKEVPIHGGFNSMTIKRWGAKNMQYVELNYEDGIISGHRNYNYFFVDGIRSVPHLMETYVGITHKRTLANVDNDKYPDYFEYLFADSSNYIAIVDSIPFYWNAKKQLYLTHTSGRWWRKY